ncbi:MAG: bifunctional phosphoribosylaminoimidazolecarboxamide formyltransferase/IMP cyclohydrolase [bacterium]
MEKTAYLSVTDKTGIADLADGLIQAGFHVYSSGSTAKTLRQAEHIIEEIPDPPPRCESVIKALGANPDVPQVEEFPVPKPSVVAANLYPLAQVLKQKDLSIEELPHYLDIWTSALLRTAARAFNDTIVLCDPLDYGPTVEALLEFGELSLERRRHLASKAYSYCAYYDSTIAQYLMEKRDLMMTDELVMGLKKICDLPYGENPHQKSALYSLSGARNWGVTALKELQGKPLNLNHYLDLDTSWDLAGEFDEPACAMVKHCHPCGVACSSNLSEAFRLAFRADPQGALGGTAALNRQVDAETARVLTEEFVECVVAPDYSEEALAILKLKKVLHILSLPSTLLSPGELQIYSVSGGVLLEEKNNQTFLRETGQVTKRLPSDIELHSLKFAWKVAKHAKSYAVVLVQGTRTVGIGTGQPSRLDSLKIALNKAAEKHPIVDPHAPIVLASDCSLPLKCLHEAAKAGITAIIQPGGAPEDKDCVSVCDSRNMTMLFTGIRHLKH